uniref:Glutaredoxin domain-containing protein n=1 Tax=Molossus molossus TaxID=27622 RepID=A0A7J8G093_MOLMO|nr:hypothetical protein HJG59_008169 [Molossus molossus]
MGCGKSSEVRAAAQPEPEAKGQRGPGGGSSAKDHLSRQTLPGNAATGVSGPTGPTGTAITDPRARLQDYIDSHPVVIFSKSTCKRCAEVKKLFKSMCVPYFLLQLDQAEDGPGLEGALAELTAETDVPVVFVKRRKLGGHGPTLKPRVNSWVEGKEIFPLAGGRHGGTPASAPSPGKMPGGWLRD